MLPKELIQIIKRFPEDEELTIANVKRLIFVQVWNDSSSLIEVCRKLRDKKDNIKQYASYLRRRNHSLKKFNGE